jgi:hypothetical protein
MRIGALTGVRLGARENLPQLGSVTDESLKKSRQLLPLQSKGDVLSPLQLR